MRTALLAGTLLVALAGCVSASEGQTPGAAAGGGTPIAEGFPSLRTVPRETIANTDAEHWSEVEADLIAAGEAVRAHPRAQLTPGEDAAAFIEQARRDLEAARAAHEPD